MIHLFSLLADLLWPPACVVCGGRSPRAEIICTTCRDHLQPAGGWRCPRCELPRLNLATPCLTCGETNEPVDAVFSAWWFEPTVQQAVHALKYRNRPEVGEYLGRLAGESCAKTEFPVLDGVIGVPLHPTRKRERGYNQSWGIARGAAAVLGFPCRNELLQRVRYTRSQTTLNETERQVNVSGAFRIAPGSAVADRVFLLTDDVLTTGATLSAAAQALRAAGAARVYALTIGKAGTPPPALPPVETVTL